MGQLEGAKKWFSWKEVVKIYFKKACRSYDKSPQIEINIAWFAHPKWKDPYFADWTDPESDDDLKGPDEEIFSCLSVCLEIIQMDTLQKCSAFMLAKMKKSPETLIVEDKPLPKQIQSLILSFISQDLCK